MISKGLSYCRYNGLPFGLSDYKFPWSKDPENPLRDKHTFVCHAEVNAILNKNCIDLKGCTLYVALFPCNECAKMVIQSRIKDIIYLSDKHKHKQKTMASKIMLDEAGIPYKQFVPKQRKIVIDFDEIDYNAKKIEDGVGSLTIWVTSHMQEHIYYLYKWYCLSYLTNHIKCGTEKSAELIITFNPIDWMILLIVKQSCLI